MKIITAAIGGTAAALATYPVFVRPWHLKWGATEEEQKMSLPGDELVEHPKLNSTHAITINAATKDVWPWVVQMGQRRGGFYSYTFLENLVGCQMRNANEIVPAGPNSR